MPVSPLAYLRHIIAETAYLTERTEGVTKDDFLRDETLRRACVRSLEVIGEAARRVAEDLDKVPVLRRDVERIIAEEFRGAEL